MKKLLLSLAGALLLAPAAMADTVSINANDATDIQGTDIPEKAAEGSSNGEARHIQPLQSLHLGDYTLTFEKGTASTDCAYYYYMSTNETGQCTVRLYGGNKMTFAAPEGQVVTQIQFNGSNAKKMNEITLSTGAIYGVDSEEAPTATANKFVWKGEANSIDFTFAGTYRIQSIDVTFTQGDVSKLSAMPTFNPASCDFTEPMAVEIAAAEGAVIYYTTDGTDPTTASEIYSTPIVVSQTTTIKAIAVEEGKEPSSVAAATYTKVVSYSTLKEYMEAGLADTSKAVRFSGEATVVYQNGKYLYLQDDSASMLAFGQLTQTYEPGDVISGFEGKMTVYNNLDELNVVAATFGEPIRKAAAPTPVTADLENLTAENQNQYVMLEKVTVKAVTNEETNKTTYYLVDEIDAELILYPRFTNVEIPTDDTVYNVVGFVSVFKEDIQIFPISFTDAAAVKALEVAEGNAAYFNLQGVRVAAPAKGQLLIKVANGKASKVIF